MEDLTHIEYRLKFYDNTTFHKYINTQLSFKTFPIHFHGNRYLSVYTQAALCEEIGKRLLIDSLKESWPESVVCIKDGSAYLICQFLFSHIVLFVSLTKVVFLFHIHTESLIFHTYIFYFYNSLPQMSTNLHESFTRYACASHLDGYSYEQ